MSNSNSKVFRRNSSLCLTLLLLGLCGLPSQASADEYHQNFRVATLNVRHETSADTGDFSWANREDAVLESVRANNPDIFGLQEASSDPINDAFAAEFSSDYGFYRPPGGSPKTIFYRASRFERLSPDESGNIYFPNPYDSSESCYPNARSRTMAWVKLRDLQSDRVYLVINLHVAHQVKCWKARNAAAEFIHEFLADHTASGASFVIFGDLNLDEQAATGADSRDTMVSQLEESKAGYHMRMSARHSGDTGKSTRTFNNAWKGPSTRYRRYDYIYANSMDATTYRTAVDRRSIRDLMGSGPDISPSDHFLVRAEVRQAPFAYHPVLTSYEGDKKDHYSFGDVDGDGKTDLIVWKSTVESGRVRVHLADGSGGFDPVAKIDSNTGAAGEYRFFADIDGDGCADRISWSAGIDGGAVRVGKSNCDGTFEADETSNSGTSKSGTKWFFARLNDDACMDRIAWHPDVDGGQTRVALAKCDGSLEFEAEQLSDDTGKTSNAGADISFADVDGDGLDDKIVWDLNLRSGRTTVYASQGDGSFGLLSEHSGGSSGNAETQFYFGDTNGDGRAEKIFWRYNYHQGFLKMYPGGDDGFIGHPMVVNNAPSTDKKSAYHLADVTGDGSADLIHWNRSAEPGKIRVFPALVAQEQPTPPDPETPDPETPDAGPTPTNDAGADAKSETPDSANSPDIHSEKPDTSSNPDDDQNDPNSEHTNTNLSGNSGCGCSSSDSGDAAGWLSFMLFIAVGRIFRRSRD